MPESRQRKIRCKVPSSTLPTQPERPELFRPERFPVFNCLVNEGRYYGFPVFGVPGFKFGKYHHFEEQGPADQIDFEPRWDDEELLPRLGF